VSKRLTPYGCGADAPFISKVGGKGKTPHSLAARMPSPEIAAKVGGEGIVPVRTHRVVRRNALG